MSKDRAPSRFSRRDFGKLVKNGLAVYGLYRLGLGWALDVPNNPDTFQAGGYEPGWLETRNPERPPFITGDGFGEKKYLKYMATHDPLLKNIHSRAFADFINMTKKKQTLRENFWQNILHSYNEMKYSLAHVHDIVHTSLFSYASVYSNFYTVGDVYGSFGVYDETLSLPLDTNFDIGAYARNIPFVFKNTALNDVSKMQHFAGFAYLAHQEAYASAHHLPEAENMPRLAHLLASVGRTPEETGYVFSLMGELEWERSETKRWINDMFHRKEVLPPTQGFLSPDFCSDFVASVAGLQFGLSLSGDITSGDELSRRCAVLDNPMQLVPENLLAVMQVQ